YLRDLGPGEIVRLTRDGVEVLQPPGEEMRICTFLWTYYGYPTSRYEGQNVELSRNRNGSLLAEHERVLGTMPEVDYVCGVPDSGIAHALGYAAESKMPFGRPFIKYTPTWPRSFMPQNQTTREHIAQMKLVPIPELIQGKRLLFVDDSIVRGTQLRGTVNYLYENGAREVHMRSACPPILFGCKFLNFSRSTSEMELIARRTILDLEGDAGSQHLEEYANGTTDRGKALRAHIASSMGFDSLEYQSLEGVMRSTGVEPCKLCTYCWNGKE
ncbi:MAG: amidophosphoribosyltransferase, partial [bacterium]